jgi:hypothetical protein
MATGKFVNNDYFEKIDNGKKAYLLGFLIADGSIVSQKVNKQLNHIIVCLKESDIEILEFFKSEICPEANIQVSTNVNGYKTCKIQWTSEKMVKDLEKYMSSLHRKSFDTSFMVNFDNIPNEYFRDFFRGFMDADGCIKNKFPKIELLFNSKQFAELFKNKLNELVSDVNSYIKEDSHYSFFKPRKVPLFRLYISSQEKRKGINFIERDKNIYNYVTNFYDFLYKDVDFYMSRKKERFTKYRANFLNSKRSKSSVEHSK